MGESGRLPERFAAAFLFCPQRRISGAFRTPHRGLRFVIALANTTSISCGRFRAQLRAATSDSAPYIRLCGQTFFPSLRYAIYRYGKYRSAALGMTNIQKPSPHSRLVPSSADDFFLLYLVLSQVRCFALRLPTLCLIFVSADRLFSFSLLCPLPIRQVSICGAVQPRRSESVRSKNSALSLKNS